MVDVYGFQYVRCLPHAPLMHGLMRVGAVGGDDHEVLWDAADAVLGCNRDRPFGCYMQSRTSMWLGAATCHLVKPSVSRRCDI